MYEKLIVDTESPSGLRWVSGRNKGKPIGTKTVNTCGYTFWTTNYGGKTCPAHRIVYELTYGPIPKGFQVDHIDRDSLNNNPSNLRLASPSDNQCNRAAPERVLPRGVSQTPSGSFACRVKKSGATMCKNFKELDDAIEWLKEKRRELHGEFACN